MAWVARICATSLFLIRIALRTRHWRRKIYAHMLNVVAVNAHILYKDYHAITRKNSSYTLKGFITLLIKQLGNVDDSNITVDITPVNDECRRLNTNLMHETICFKRPRNESNGKQQDMRHYGIVCVVLESALLAFYARSICVLGMITYKNTK